MTSRSAAGNERVQQASTVQQAQRVDIADVVEGFLEAERGLGSDDLFEAVKRKPRPRKAPRATPIEPLPGTEAPPPHPDGSWYVVIDEIVETTVTFEAWPWPSIDPQTRFLSFDLSQTRRRTVDLDDLQQVVDRRRAERDASGAAERPLRIGDVFEVGADDVRDPTAWTVVVDDTRRKRREAQAALYAMAAPPLFHASEDLEAIARESEQSEDQRPAGANNAFPAI